MDKSLPLPALLCHTFVAFTIECDNEFERQMPHRTTDYGLGNPEQAATHGFAPWLVSLAMWFNCMKYVGEQGVTVGELERQARTITNLDGMRRWGYITLAPNSAGQHLPLPKSKPKPKKDWLIRATPAGHRAREIWQPLCATIEQRWQQRFGKSKTGNLRQSLSALVSQLAPDLPDAMPILGYGLYSKGSAAKPRGISTHPPADVDALEFPSLLARVLLCFALEFDEKSEVSLAISANLLRLLKLRPFDLRHFEQSPLRVRDLPQLSGISKEAVAMAISFLAKRKYATLATESASRTKNVALTTKGLHASEAYGQLVRKIEELWRQRFGEDVITGLRTALEQLIEPEVSPSRLFEGMKPNPDGWRAKLPAPEVLPHFPTVLHRGGYPDGS